MGKKHKFVVPIVITIMSIAFVCDIYAICWSESISRTTHIIISLFYMIALAIPWVLIFKNKNRKSD